MTITNAGGHTTDEHPQDVRLSSGRLFVAHVVNMVDGCRWRILRHGRERILKKGYIGAIVIAGVSLIAGSAGAFGGYAYGQHVGIRMQQAAFAATANELIIQPATLPESQQAFKVAYPEEQIKLGYRSPADVFTTVSGRILICIGGVWVEIGTPLMGPEWGVEAK